VALSDERRSQIRGAREFFRNYWPFIAIAGVVNSCIARMLEPSIGSGPNAWTQRIALWSGLLLLDNLGVLWWYAHLTGLVAGAAIDQAAASSEQLDLLRSAAQESRRPIAVSQRVRVPGQPGTGRVGEGVHYVVRNIGPGFALNVYWVAAMSQAGWRGLRNLGSLAAGGELRLPEDLEQPLRDGSGLLAHLLIAESADWHMRWSVTLNVRLPDGFLNHEIYFRASERAAATVEEFIATEKRGLKQAIDRFAEHVGKRPDTFEWM